MKIFMCYASEQRPIADKVALALRGQGHTVFFDRDSLPGGDEYNKTIRSEIRRADLMVFLVSPQSLGARRYTLSELEFARQTWQSPKGRLLPVVIEPVVLADAPAMLTAVSVLEPQGDIVAEVLAAVDRISGRKRTARMRTASLVVVAIVAAGGFAAVATGVWPPGTVGDDEPAACYLRAQVEAPGVDRADLLLNITHAGATESFLVDDNGTGLLQVDTADGSAWQVEVVDRDGVPLGSADLTGCPSSPAEVAIGNDVSITISVR